MSADAAVQLQQRRRRCWRTVGSCPTGSARRMETPNASSFQFPVPAEHGEAQSERRCESCEGRRRAADGAVCSRIVEGKLTHQHSVPVTLRAHAEWRREVVVDAEWKVRQCCCCVSAKTDAKYGVCECERRRRGGRQYDGALLQQLQETAPLLSALRHCSLFHSLSSPPCCALLPASLRSLPAHKLTVAGNSPRLSARRLTVACR